MTQRTGRRFERLSLFSTQIKSGLVLTRSPAEGVIINHNGDYMLITEKMLDALDHLIEFV